jgi:hypothetical protein
VRIVDIILAKRAASDRARIHAVRRIRAHDARGKTLDSGVIQSVLSAETGLLFRPGETNARSEIRVPDGCQGVLSVGKHVAVPHDWFGAASADLSNLWSRAANQVPGWKSITAPLPVHSGEPLSFATDTGDGGQPQKRSTLALDSSTAAVVRYETFSEGNPGRKLRTWSRFVHTGEYYGVVGQTIAGLASTAGVMLVWTGISLALRRHAAWSTRRRKKNVSREEQLIA